MFPIRDDQPRYSIPLVNYFLIGINLLIFLLETRLTPRNLETLIFQFGLIPSHFTAFIIGQSHQDPVRALVPLLSSMFLHGSIMHVLGNMWFLWIFGDNIEDYLGHLKYLVFFLISGIIALLAQIALMPHSQIPTVGASGAIAGVLGGYFLMYPRARVYTWLPPIFLFHLPAWVMLGYWFALQFLSGTATSLAYANDSRGGVAFWAHVGGFAAGLIMIKLFPPRVRRQGYVVG